MNNLRYSIKNSVNKLIINSLFLFLTIISSSFNTISLQNDPPKEVYPQDYFRSPLNIPLFLAGTFGELRPNHFHSGIDIKTNGKEGFPIYAVADGYVSRLRIQSTGFGNALYITHPNGFVSVYGHLQRYNSVLANFARTTQYKNEVFEIDTLLSSSLFHVKKGEIIAYSGNSGSSGGPHLHFEMRDAVTEETINPLLFGFKIEDRVSPIVNSIYVYPLDANSSVNNEKIKQRFSITGTKPDYTVNNGTIINAWGTIGIGIDCFDLQSGSANKNGIYSIELKVNGERIYYSQMERFAFKNTRAINSHCDFKERITNGSWIQKSFVEGGNMVGIYKDLINQGRVILEPGDLYNFEYLIRDVEGNTSTVRFAVNTLDENPYSYLFSTLRNTVNFWGYQHEQQLTKEHLKVIFPPYTFYDSILLTYTTTPKPATGLSRVHVLGNTDIPINNTFSIEITPDQPMSEYQKAKAIIVNKGRGSVGGTVKNGSIKASPKNLGGFYITTDMVPPTIKTVNISNNKNMSTLNGILLKISDNLSGIKSYRATIDDQWILMEFDQRYNLLSYKFDELCPKGKHVFRLVVTDQKNNTSQYLATFTR